MCKMYNWLGLWVDSMKAKGLNCKICDAFWSRSTVLMDQG
jgi:hypothetical protein